MYIYIYTYIYSKHHSWDWVTTDMVIKSLRFSRLAFFEMVKMTDTAEPLIHLSNFCQWSFWICSQGLALRHSSLKEQSPMPDNIKNIPLRTENEHCNSYFLRSICSLPAIAAGWCALNTSRHGKWRCSFIRRGNRPLVVSHRYAKWMNVLVRCFTVPNNCVFFLFNSNLGVCSWKWRSNDLMILMPGASDVEGESFEKPNSKDWPGDDVSHIPPVDGWISGAMLPGLWGIMMSHHIRYRDSYFPNEQDFPNCAV